MLEKIFPFLKKPSEKINPVLEASRLLRKLESFKPGDLINYANDFFRVAKITPENLTIYLETLDGKPYGNFPLDKILKQNSGGSFNFQEGEIINNGEEECRIKTVDYSKGIIIVFTLVNDYLKIEKTLKIADVLKDNPNGSFAPTKKEEKKIESESKKNNPYESFKLGQRITINGEKAIISNIGNETAIVSFPRLPYRTETISLKLLLQENPNGSIEEGRESYDYASNNIFEDARRMERANTALAQQSPRVQSRIKGIICFCLYGDMRKREEMEASDLRKFIHIFPSGDSAREPLLNLLAGVRTDGGNNDLKKEQYNEAAKILFISIYGSYDETPETPFSKSLKKKPLSKEEQLLISALGIDVKTITLEELKEKYKKLAKDYHPDNRKQRGDDTETGLKKEDLLKDYSAGFDEIKKRFN